MLLFTRRMTEWIQNAMQVTGDAMPGVEASTPPVMAGGKCAAVPIIDVSMEEDDRPPRDLVISSAMATTMTENSDLEEQVKLSKQKLMQTLSFSFPNGSLSNAFAKVKAEAEPLSQSCFSQIRLDRGADDFDDEELTSLAWLQDKNLLKNISGNTRLCPSPPSSDDEFSNDDDYESGKENDSLSSSFNSVNSPLPHPSHIPYNPQKHVNSKPPYSFSCLIFMAIEDAPDKKLPVKDIYSWILTHFPYFQNAPVGWKNSVRHNLSLNKCFQKVDKERTLNVGKGSYWCIDPDYRPNLLQALRKTPYHPYHQLQMMSASPLSLTPQKSPFGKLGLGSNISPHLFPFLSRRLNSAKSDILDTDIELANALVSLKKPLYSHNSPSSSSRNSRPRTTNKDRRSRSPSPPEFGSAEDRGRTTRRSRTVTSPIIITEAPSTDHSYSSCSVPRGLFGSPNSSSIDGEYEFNTVDEAEGLASGDEFDSAEEEEMSMEIDSGKEMEGVNALLNLASIATSVMPDSSKTDTATTTIAPTSAVTLDSAADDPATDDPATDADQNNSLPTPPPESPASSPTFTKSVSACSPSRKAAVRSATPTKRVAASRTAAATRTTASTRTSPSTCTPSSIKASPTARTNPISSRTTSPASRTAGRTATRAATRSAARSMRSRNKTKTRC